MECGPVGQEREKEGTAEESSRAGSNSITSIGGGGREKGGWRTGFANDTALSTDLLFQKHLTSIVVGSLFFMSIWW